MSCHLPAANAAIYRAIADELERQMALHGPAHAGRQFAAILGEEFGEVCRAHLEQDTAALRAELVQLAATAVQWLEFLNSSPAADQPMSAAPPD